MPVFLKYKGEEIGEAYRIDMLVDYLLILELKATDSNHPLYAAQCLTYLKAAGLSLGLVINFGVPMLKDGIERVANNFTDK